MSIYRCFEISYVTRSSYNWIFYLTTADFITWTATVWHSFSLNWFKSHFFNKSYKNTLIWLKKNQNVTMVYVLKDGESQWSIPKESFFAFLRSNIIKKKKGIFHQFSKSSKKLKISCKKLSKCFFFPAESSFFKLF